jgi:peptide/nickel transport system substrate-binding protein
MKKLRWQILTVVISLVLVGVLLLTQQTTVLGPSEPQAAPGGVYTEAMVGSMSRLNPLLDWNNAPDHEIDRLIFSGLVRFDARGVPQADLAESWGTSQDGTLYNFSLRPNAVWHDGTPVTSDDVIFTIELIKSQASFYPQDVKDMWAQVQIKALNDKLIQFVLPEPYAPFLDYLSFGVLPKHLLESVPAEKIADAEFNLKPIGTGPYRFDHLLVENSQIAGVVLVANETYYAGRPYLDQIVFRYYATSEDALLAYHEGEVLGIHQITADILQDALAEPNLNIYTSRLPALSMVLINLENSQVPFFQVVEVRQALLAGTNRQWMVDRILKGQAIVADSPILPGTWASYDGITQVPYDPDAAIKILKDAGYVLPADGGNVRAKEGQSLVVTLVHPDDDLHTALAESVQHDWAKLGIQVTLQAQPYAQLINDTLPGRAYQAALVDLTLMRTPDPDPYPFWHQAEKGDGQNYSQWDDRAASEYLEQARVTTDMNFRARLYRNFQVLFAKQVPAILLYYPVYSFGIDQQMQGVQVGPLFDLGDRFVNITEWHLVTRRMLEQMTPTVVP